jgi:hypothetical protein
MATVVAYINAYKTNPAAKQHYWNQMSQYIAASCWPKMYNCATHWSSLGFLYHLCQFRETYIQHAYSVLKREGELPQRKDGGLTNLFLAVEKEEGFLESIMRKHPDPAHRTSQLVHLSNAFESANDSTTPINIYNGDTCCEFHHFLVALLFAYIKSLQALRRKQDVSLGFSFYNLGMILWQVAHSNMLRVHLNTLHVVGEVVGVFLRMPDDAHKVWYWKHFQGVWRRDEGKKLAEGEDEEEGEDQDFGEEDDQDAALEDFRQLQGQTATRSLDTDLSLVYRGWLKLLATHFGSLDILSKFSIRSHKGAGDVQAKLLAMRPRDRTLSMVDWKNLVMELAEPSLSADGKVFTHDNAVAAVTLLQSHIDGTSSNNILNSRRSLGSSHKVHCEAAMASFLKYSDRANCDACLPPFKVRSHCHLCSLT